MTLSGHSPALYRSWRQIPQEQETRSAGPAPDRCWQSLQEDTQRVRQQCPPRPRRRGNGLLAAPARVHLRGAVGIPRLHSGRESPQWAHENLAHRSCLWHGYRRSSIPERYRAVQMLLCIGTHAGARWSVAIRECAEDAPTRVSNGAGRYPTVGGAAGSSRDVERARGPRARRRSPRRRHQPDGAARH